MANVDKLISADSHVVEPPDLFVARIDARYRDRAPRVVSDGGVDRWFVDGDIVVGSIGAPTQAGRRFEDKESLSLEFSYEEATRAAYDPHLRMSALERDGVVGEVVFPTIAVRLYETAIDTDLLSACCRAINDWMAQDFAGAYPETIKGTALLNVDDVDEAVAELERGVKMGLVAGCIPAYPGEGRTYDLPRCERLWAAAQALGVPLCTHSGSYRPGPGVLAMFSIDVSQRGIASFQVSEDYWPRRAVADMMFAGVFERFPGLQIGVIEFELSWAPYFIQQMDRRYEDHRYVKDIRFKEGWLPSDFFHRNVFVAFQEDIAGIANRHIVGIDNIVWGSDFPHTESTWPHSREMLAKLLHGVAQEEVDKLAFGNAARIFGFD